MKQGEVIDYERFLKKVDLRQFYLGFIQKGIESAQRGEELQLSQFIDLKDDLVAQLSLYMYCSMMYAFEGYDKQVYVLGKTLSQMFVNTKLPKLSLDDVKLPYPCFYIALPEIDGLSFYDPETQQHRRVYGCYIYDSRDPANIMRLTVPDGTTVNHIHLIILVHNTDNPTNLDNDIASVVSLRPGEKDLEGYITSFKKLQSYNDPISDIFRILCRLSLNLIFYLNSSNREIGVVERPDQRRIKNLESRLKTTRISKKRIRDQLTEKIEKERNKVIVTYLAPTIEEEGERLLSIPTGRVVREHWVSGFYNYYWCNNHDEEGNKIEGKHVESRWIQPQRRGSAIGEAIRKKYQLSDTK